MSYLCVDIEWNIPANPEHPMEALSMGAVYVPFFRPAPWPNQSYSSSRVRMAASWPRAAPALGGELADGGFFRPVLPRCLGDLFFSLMEPCFSRAVDV